MKQITELLEVGMYQDLQVKEAGQTIAEYIKELGLEGNYFGILVNGKKVVPEYRLKKADTLVILPIIAGGV